MCHEPRCVSVPVMDAWGRRRPFPQVQREAHCEERSHGAAYCAALQREAHCEERPHGAAYCAALQREAHCVAPLGYAVHSRAVVLGCGPHSDARWTDCGSSRWDATYSSGSAAAYEEWFPPCVIHYSCCGSRPWQFRPPVLCMVHQLSWQQRGG